MTNEQQQIKNLTECLMHLKERINTVLLTEKNNKERPFIYGFAESLKDQIIDVLNPLPF